MQMHRKTWIGLVAAAVGIAGAVGACERRKQPAASDAAQKELERRQPDLMAEMDRIAAQQLSPDSSAPPGDASGSDAPPPPPSPQPSPPPPPSDGSAPSPGGQSPADEPSATPMAPPPG